MVLKQTIPVELKFFFSFHLPNLRRLCCVRHKRRFREKRERMEGLLRSNGYREFEIPGAVARQAERLPADPRGARGQTG